MTGQHLTEEVLPDEGALTLAWRRSVASRHVASRIESAIQEAQQHAAEAPVPDDLAPLVAAGLQADPTQSWDDLVQRLAMQHGGKEGR